MGGAVWLAVALGVAVEASRLGLGAARRPGPGFLPLAAALVLALGALVVIGQALAGRGAAAERGLWPDLAGWRRGLFALAALVGYALFLERLGFLLVTFLLIGLLLRAVEEKPWPVALGFAAATAAATAVLFGTWLKAPLPAGILALPGF